MNEYQVHIFLTNHNITHWLHLLQIYICVGYFFTLLLHFYDPRVLFSIVLIVFSILKVSLKKHF